MPHDNSRTYFVYILASKPRGTIYIGVTNSILTRIEQHRAGIGSAFTKRDKVHTLVWLELHSDIIIAIQREKTIKHYTRDWKINLIERENPQWLDLYPTLPGAEHGSLHSPGCTLKPRDKPEDGTAA
jgi:putative endonuclease